MSLLGRGKLRVARPSRDLAATQKFYCEVLGLQLLGSFVDHDGFDGIMVGDPASNYHFEFTFHRGEPVVPSPTPEDLTVFYVPDRDEWSRVVSTVESAGVRAVPSHNPYWDLRGRTFCDPDGYRVVIQNEEWDA